MVPVFLMDGDMVAVACMVVTWFPRHVNELLTTEIHDTSTRHIHAYTYSQEKQKQLLTIVPHTLIRVYMLHIHSYAHAHSPFALPAIHSG